MIVGNVLVSVGKGWITFFRYPCFINTPAGNQHIPHMNGIQQNLWNAVCGTIGRREKIADLELIKLVLYLESAVFD